MKHYLLDYPLSEIELGKFPQQKSIKGYMDWDNPFFILNQSRYKSLDPNVATFDILLYPKAKVTDFIDSYGNIGKLVSEKVMNIIIKQSLDDSANFIKIKVYHKAKEYQYYLLFSVWSDKYFDFDKSSCISSKFNNLDSIKKIDCLL